MPHGNEHDRGGETGVPSGRRFDEGCLSFSSEDPQHAETVDGHGTTDETEPRVEVRPNTRHSGTAPYRPMTSDQTSRLNTHQSGGEHIMWASNEKYVQSEEKKEGSDDNGLADYNLEDKGEHQDVMVPEEKDGTYAKISDDAYSIQDYFFGDQEESSVCSVGMVQCKHLPPESAPPFGAEEAFEGQAKAQSGEQHGNTTDNQEEAPKDTGTATTDNTDDSQDSENTTSMSPSEETSSDCNHDNIENSALQDNSAHTLTTMTTTTTNTSSRRTVGAFRVFPDERRVERASGVGISLTLPSAQPEGVSISPQAQVNQNENDLEEGNNINENNGTDDNASVMPMLEASLVDDDRVIEAQPIHLTHVPISSVQRGDNYEGGIKQIIAKQKRPMLFCGLLIFVSLAVAAGVGAYLGTKENENGTGTGSLGSALRGSSEADGSGSGSGSGSGTGEEVDEGKSNLIQTDLPSESEDPLVMTVFSQEPESFASQDSQATATQDSSATLKPQVTYDISTETTSTQETSTTLKPQVIADDISPIIWEQVGSKIWGTATKNRAGSSVASSNDGKIIAIGAPNNDHAATDAGQVRIFAWNDTADDWTQRGSTLLGEEEGDWFGWSMALSGSGDTLVCGAPMHNRDNVNVDSGQLKVFKWNETLADYVVWGSLHTHHRNTWEKWGWDVDISEDGLTVAVGAPGAGTPTNLTDTFGYVHLFGWNDTIMDWSNIGKFNDEQMWTEFGQSISLSSDGRTLAVGAISHDGTSGEKDVGMTRVLKWDGVSEWAQAGSAIYGEAAGDKAGWSTDLSADGKTLAISAITHHGLNGEESGHVRVYLWDDLISDWAQMGSDIDGKGEFDRFGQDVSLTDDGRTIAITSILNNGNGLRAGHCRVFQWSDSMQNWIQVGQDIQGELNDRIKSVAFSSDGTTLTVGAWGGRQATGYVSVFNSSHWDGGEYDVFN